MAIKHRHPSDAEIIACHLVMSGVPHQRGAATNKNAKIGKIILVIEPAWAHIKAAAAVSLAGKRRRYGVNEMSP